MKLGGPFLSRLLLSRSAVGALLSAALLGAAGCGDPGSSNIDSGSDIAVPTDSSVAIDAAVTSFMRGELANAGANRRYVSEVSVAVSRTTNLITSPTLPFRLRIRPLYYSTTISLDLGYALSVRS